MYLEFTELVGHFFVCCFSAITGWNSMQFDSIPFGCFFDRVMAPLLLYIHVHVVLYTNIHVCIMITWQLMDGIQWNCIGSFYTERRWQSSLNAPRYFFRGGAYCSRFIYPVCPSRLCRGYFSVTLDLNSMETLWKASLPRDVHVITMFPFVDFSELLPF